MIICIKCELEYERSSLSGAVEAMSANGPIVIQQATLWRCSGCKAEIVRADRDRAIVHVNETAQYSLIRHNFESRKALLCRVWESLRDKVTYMLQKR